MKMEIHVKRALKDRATQMCKEFPIIAEGGPLHLKVLQMLEDVFEDGYVFGLQDFNAIQSYADKINQIVQAARNYASED